MRDNRGSTQCETRRFPERHARGGARSPSARLSRSAYDRCRRAKRLVKTTSWVDSADPEVKHRMIETNGIRLHVAKQVKARSSTSARLSRMLVFLAP